jgi:hypothetical protein
MDDTEFPKELIEETEQPEPEKLFESLYQRLLNMAVNEKIRLATLGNKEARNLLIKDPNRLVIHSVLSSPKLTEDEVVSFAGNKNLSKDVANLIANKKEFLKNYAVKVALVNNPKTQVPTAIKLMPYLMEKDVRSVAKSKGVSSVVVAAARRIITQRAAK